MSGAHDAAHGHSHHVEDYAARKHPEFVVLDLGEDLGALIIHTGPQLHGVEIEISPAGQDAERTHKQVLERSAGGRAQFTAVFDGLASGVYTLWCDGRARVRGVKIEAGKIAQLEWGEP
jgi:hypothetical protein